MPLILSGNVASATAGGYEVANSCIFDDGGSAYMYKTPGSVGDLQKWTYSVWFKRGNLGSEQYLLEYNEAADHDDNFRITFSSSDTIYIQDTEANTSNLDLRTNQVFRDCSAWYNLIIAVDTTQSTAANRCKVYLNGTQITSWATETYPDQNYNTNVNVANENIVIGRRESIASPTSYFDGYMAEVVFIDGTQYANTDFGEFDEDSPTIWKPKDVSGLTFGTNGFYLDFEASGNLGNDANGGTDLTESGLAATDQATDTPTNNFCTISPVAHQTTVQVLSEGNLQGTKSGSGGVNAATIAPTGGKWYAEFFVNTYGSNGINAGVINVDSHARWNVASTALGDDEFSAGYYSTGILYRNSETNHTGNTNDDFDSYGADDIISIAMDLDNGFFYWAKNGTWQNSGDPTSAGTGTGGVATSYVTANETYVYAAWIRNGSVISWNFGNPPTTFSISSGNADANGYGNFEYAPPSGFYALCTKNLAELGG